MICFLIECHPTVGPHPLVCLKSEARDPVLTERNHRHISSMKSGLRRLCRPRHLISHPGQQGIDNMLTELYKHHFVVELWLSLFKSNSCERAALNVRLEMCHKRACRSRLQLQIAMGRPLWMQTERFRIFGAHCGVVIDAGNVHGVIYFITGIYVQYY